MTHSDKPKKRNKRPRKPKFLDTSLQRELPTGPCPPLWWEKLVEGPKLSSEETARRAELGRIGGPVRQDEYLYPNSASSVDERERERNAMQVDRAEDDVVLSNWPSEVRYVDERELDYEMGIRPPPRY
jgi:hypothetical protein